MRENNNTAACRNYCQATGECLIEAILDRRFDGERVFELAEYIRGPQVVSSLMDYFQEQMASYYEPENIDSGDEIHDSEVDIFTEDINRSLAPDEEPYTTTRQDSNSMVTYVLDPYIWRQRGIQCERSGVNFMVSTVVSREGSFQTTARQLQIRRGQ
jgi:hypothetical protein